MAFAISSPNSHAIVKGPAHPTTVEEEMAKLEEHCPNEAVWLKGALLGEHTED